MTARRSPHSPPDTPQLPHLAPEPTPTPTGEGSIADTTERLFSAFDAQIGLATIADVVHQCRRELDIVSGPALPELLERLARQRLTDRAARAN